MINYIELKALDTLKTISMGFPYYATEKANGKYRIMNDIGEIRWYNKNHFVEVNNESARLQHNVSDSMQPHKVRNV